MSPQAGLAGIVEELVRQNLERDPSRRRLLRPTIVVLEASDAGVVATVRVTKAGVTARDGDDPRAAVRVRADAARLLDLAIVPLVLGLPDPRSPEGRAVVADLLAGRYRIDGLARHPLQALRFLRLLSAR
jgi:hypothetical protein